MDDDRNTIAREVNVAFEAVAVQCEAVGKRGHRVLGRKFGTSAMCEDQFVATVE